MKILKVDKDKVQVELTREEVAILVNPTFTVSKEADSKSIIEQHKKVVELYDSVIRSLGRILKDDDALGIALSHGFTFRLS